MKSLKYSLGVAFLCTVVGSILGTQNGTSGRVRVKDEEIEKILAKYGIDRSTKPVNKAPGVIPNQAGILMTNTSSKPTTVPSTEEIQKTVEMGKQLERAVENIDDEKFERMAQETNIEDDKKELEKSAEDTKVKEPGFFSRIWGMIKIAETIATFNKRAIDNLARFKVTFKNVSDSLVSFSEDTILIPDKDTRGDYRIDKATKAIKWKLVKNKLTTPELQTLKQECLYIIIKEMVDGFKHLDPVVGRGISALSFLAPQAAKQSVLIYEVATKFLPMLEKIAQENFESASEKLDSDTK